MTKERGFSLIEILLASFIFMSVVTIAIGSFTSQITLQTSSEAQRTVQQSTQAVVEAISRDVRMATTFTLTDPVSCTVLGGRPLEKCGRRLEVRFRDGTKKTYVLAGVSVTMIDNDDTVFELTDPQAVQAQGSFEAIEPAADPQNQKTMPFVILHLSVSTVPTGRPEGQASLSVRTMVSSRLFEKYVTP